jgi:HprK-related kinase A
LKVSELSSDDLARGRLLLAIPPFVVSLSSDCPALWRDFSVAYADFEIASPGQFTDFYIDIKLDSGFRRWVKPQAKFYFDGRPSFVPLPAHQAFTMFEWGLNWCIAAHAHQYLVIHAAVVEKNGKSVILPAPPGSGKSTLCAALIQRGWRLLSDELALYDFESGLIYGMARPVNLKNASIDVIRQFEPSVQMTVPVPDTSKGKIALLKPPFESVLRASDPVSPNFIVLPKYLAGASAELLSHPRAKTFMLLAEQSFNYDIHGERGFKALGKLVDQCSCFQFTYSLLDEAISAFAHLAEFGVEQ